MLKLYYLTLLVFFCIFCKVAAVNSNSTEFLGKYPNATLYIGAIPKFTCNKIRPMSMADIQAASDAMDKHFKRGQWGQKCYDGWCVDARNLIAWDSPKDCMNELRGKLIECLFKHAGDGYVEQNTGWASSCMMHYWCDGC